MKFDSLRYEGLPIKRHQVEYKRLMSAFTPNTSRSVTGSSIRSSWNERRTSAVRSRTAPCARSSHFKRPAAIHGRGCVLLERVRSAQRTQTPQFLIATDRPGNLSSTRLETTCDCSLPPHAPGADRFGNSGECVLLGIFANEGAADEPASTRSDEDGVGGCQIAYACGNN